MKKYMEEAGEALLAEIIAFAGEGLLLQCLMSQGGITVLVRTFERMVLGG